MRLHYVDEGPELANILIGFIEANPKDDCEASPSGLGTAAYP